MTGSVRSFVLLLAAAGLLGATAQAQSPSSSPQPLLARMVAQSESVQSYTAAIHADIAMRTFPYLSPSLDGMYYHKEPSKNKIVFTSALPFIAKQFSKIYPEVESPSRWNDVYVVTAQGDADGMTTFKLVPRKHGRVDHIDAKVDDKTAEVTSLRWNYNDGGYATLDQTYGTVAGHLLVTQQIGHVEVPHYTADLKSTFSNFKINTPIPDSVFQADSCRAGRDEESRGPGAGKEGSMAQATVDLTTALLADQFNRPITYLRISVTDKCNLRCVYCMPENGLPWLQKSQILSYEEIARIVRAAASAGVRSIRLSGGEPLVRKNLARLVESIASTPGIEDVSLSTNGLLLEEQIDELVSAGLRRVNVSLDTLRPDRFESIARRPGLERVLAGIDAAIDRGLAPVKINCVVMRESNDDEIEDFAAFSLRRPVFVRFIEMMPVHENLDVQRQAYVSADEILERLARNGVLRPCDGPGGNGPARYFAFEGAAGAVGVISPLSHDYCERCNRVRLTADGRLRLCLFGDHEIDLRTPLREGATTEGIAQLLRAAMLIKPERHHLRLGEAASRMRAFSEIGG